MTANHRIQVVPLGPGDPELLTLQSANLLRSGVPVLLRTSRHPVASWLNDQMISFSSLDYLHESSESFDDMNRAMAKAVIEQAEKRNLVYAVPDPVSDQSVAALLHAAREKAVSVIVLPGVTSAVSCLSAGEPIEQGGLEHVVRVSALDFPETPWDPRVSTVITELDSALLSGMIKLRLMEYLGDEQEILFFPPSESANRKAVRITLCELDRQKSYDQTTALLVPAYGYLERTRFCFQDLVDLISRLRARDGAPVDRNQTHESLQPCLEEACRKAIAAIENDDPDLLSDEIGELLRQVVFHSSIGESYDEFSLTDVISEICRKIILLHSDLFPGAAVLPHNSEKQ